MSATLVSVSSFAPSRSRAAGTLRLRRWGRLPANQVSPAKAPFSEALTWWSTGSPDSEAPCRNTSSVAVPEAEAPASAKETVRVAPELSASQSQGSGASSRPGW